MSLAFSISDDTAAWERWLPDQDSNLEPTG